jgi:outer membrane receptor for ferric coprogen and ferric-rhodotorulic acid
MFSSFTGSFSAGRRKPNSVQLTPPSGLDVPEQLITNYDFSDGANGWTVGGGVGTYSYTSSNQVAVYNGQLYFTYVLRTVTRNIDVSGIIADAVSLKATANLRHREKSDAATYTQIDKYTFTVAFKNSSGATVITKTTGLSNAPQDFTDINLTLNWSEIPSTFSTITTAAISISGIDTGYWNGNHGPIVDYIKLVAS